MNLDKYTDRAKGLLQAAQHLAIGRGHQQFTPEHLLKVLIDDEQGLAAGLIEAAGGDAGRPTTALNSRSASSPRLRARGPASFISRHRPRGCSPRPRKRRRRPVTAM